MAEEWPEDLEPTEVTWGVVYNNRGFTSSLSNAQQIAAQPGAYWKCTMTFGVLYDEDEREMTSLLGRLQGMFGTVNQAIATEVVDRNQAIAVETQARTKAISDESAARAQGLLSEAQARGAAITSEAQARQSADGALGQRIDTVTASTGNNASAIQSEITARTNADNALGQRIDTVAAGSGQSRRTAVGQQQSLAAEKLGHPPRHSAPS